MPDFSVNVLDFVDEKGAFTDAFKTEALPKILGTDFGETKVFDETTPTLAHAIHRLAHAERKVGQRLENVIQKPAEGASEAEKAAFRQTLLTELGAPPTAADYGFAAPSLPEGLEYDEATDAYYSALFAKHRVPKDIAAALRTAFIEKQITDHNTKVQAEQTAFDNEVRDFEAAHSGDEGKKYVLGAHEALLHFAGDDVTGADGEVVKGLKTLIKEANLRETPTDYAAWRKLGILPSQLELWGHIGERMQSGFSARDEGGGGQGGGEQNTVEKTGATYYDHPTSQKELLHQGG